MAKDPVKVDAGHYTVELENKSVRVLRIRYGPRERSVMHGHPALVGVMLTDGQMRFTYPDGKSEDIVTKAGQVLHFPAVEHLPENLTDQPLEVIAVELKAARPAAKAVKARPAARAKAKTAKRKATKPRAAKRKPTKRR
jgi:quercetin dioxygenase-like cupin family protein